MQVQLLKFGIFNIYILKNNTFKKLLNRGYNWPYNPLEVTVFGIKFQGSFHWNTRFILIPYNLYRTICKVFLFKFSSFFFCSEYFKRCALFKQYICFHFGWGVFSTIKLLAALPSLRPVSYWNYFCRTILFNYLNWSLFTLSSCNWSKLNVLSFLKLTRV